MYLVQFVCLRDRIPLYVSENRDAAVAYGTGINSLDDVVVQAAADVVDCISTKQVCVELITFDVYCVPVKREILRDFWAEEHPPAEPEATGSDDSDESDDESEHAPTELEDAGMSNDA